MKQLVTNHAPRLQKLSQLKVPTKPSQSQKSLIPRAGVGRIPARPSAPPSRVAGAVKPRREVERNVRPMDSGKINSTIARAGNAFSRINDDSELEFGAVEANVALSFDISMLDPGPDKKDVPFGFKCGSCSKFLALNDPRRDDPEFLESYLASNNHCPVAVLELAKLKGKSPEDVVAKADTVACAKFKVDHNAANPNFTKLLSDVRALTKGEYDVLVASLESIGREKQNEEKYGCCIGQKERISIAGYEGLHPAVVIGFKGKNILMRVRIGTREITVKRPIVDARVIE